MKQVLNILLPCLILLVSLIAAPAANAQQTNTQIGPRFTTPLENRNRTSPDGLSASTDAMTGADSSTDTSRWFDPNSDTLEATSSPNSQTPPASQSQSADPHAQNVLGQLVFLDSLSGFGDSMKSQTYADYTADFINSPNSVQFITWHLTEPGIAAGHNAAMTQANLLLANRYHASQALTQQFALMPEWQGSATQYFNCIKEKMAAQSQGAQGSQDRWLSAQARCAGEAWQMRSQNNAQNSNQNPSFPSVPQIFSPIDDPNVEVQNQANPATQGAPQPSGASPSPTTPTNAAPAAQNQEIKVLLSDYIFGKAQSNGAATPAPSGQANSLDGDPQEHKEWFKHDIGDIEFTFKSLEDAKTAVELSYVKVEAQKNPRTAFAELFSASYDTIKDSTKKLCEAREKNRDPKSFLEQGAGQRSFIDEVLSQCKQGSGGSNPCQTNAGASGGPLCCQIQSLNVPGFTWSIFIFDFFQRMLEPKRAADDYQSLQNTCDKLFGEGDKLAKLYGSDGVLKNPELATDPVRFMYFLAKKVATAKMYYAYKKAEEAVLLTTGGTFNPRIRNLALNLVYEAAGTGDISSAEQANLAELRNAIAQFSLAAAQQSGRAWSLIGTQHNETGMGSFKPQ